MNGIPFGMGFGTSSILTVIISCIELLLSGDIDATLTVEHKKKIFDHVFHKEFSETPGISGIDIATCVFGGFGRYKQHSSWDVLDRNHSIDIIYTNSKHVNIEPFEYEKDELDIKLVNKCIDDYIYNTSNKNKLFALNQTILNKSIPDKITNEMHEIFDAIYGCKMSGSGKGGIIIKHRLTDEDKKWLDEKNLRYERVISESNGVTITEEDWPLRLCYLQDKIIQEHESDSNDIQPKIGYASAPSNIALIKY
jgi:mevalonate kinase